MPGHENPEADKFVTVEVLRIWYDKNQTLQQSLRESKFKSSDHSTNPQTHPMQVRIESLTRHANVYFSFLSYLFPAIWPYPT